MCFPNTLLIDMKKKFVPDYLNLKFCKTQKQNASAEATLCHVEHDDFGNMLHAIPLKINVAGYITLDFENVIKIDVIP